MLFVTVISSYNSICRGGDLQSLQVIGDSDYLVVSLGRSSIIKYHRSPKVYLNWNETNSTESFQADIIN